MRCKVAHGDSRTIMAGMEANSIDAVICDPPYGLEFMGKDFDTFRAPRQIGDVNFTRGNAKHGKVRHGVGASYGKEGMSNLRAYQNAMQPIFEEALRVAKPGAHLLAFGGTRTFHRLACAIEDAGWEIRDTIMWVYGSGFPKSHDVSKAIDKAAGAERPVLGYTDPHDPRTAMARKMYGTALQDGPGMGLPITAPATPEAIQWQGWGTALKPAWEPVIVARKPRRRERAAAWGGGAQHRRVQG